MSAPPADDVSHAGDLHRFLFEGLPVRGALVRLEGCWREALARRAESGAFPPGVISLLGEMTAAGLLMQSNIKFDGALTLQLHGDGPVRLAVAEVQSNLRFRATAQVIDSVAPGATLDRLVNVGGGGRCAITLDAADRPEGTLPYQGVVPLHDDARAPLTRLSQVLEHYMLQSEQLDTRLVLAANDAVAAGLLLQRMPLDGTSSEGNDDERHIGRNEDFNRLALLAGTLTPDELLSLDPDTVLRRLFWEERVQRFEPALAGFDCSCSRERVRDMLVGLGHAEVDDIVREQGEIEVGCDFCGRLYRFDAIEAEQLFTPERDRPTTPGTLH